MQKRSALLSLILSTTFCMASSRAAEPGRVSPATGGSNSPTHARSVRTEATVGNSNCVSKYLTGADRQYETQEQGAEIRRALKAMLSMKPDQLLKKRFCDYQMHPNKWNAIQMLNRYFVPTNASCSLTPSCFSRSIRTPSSRLAIQSHLTELSKTLLSEPGKHPSQPAVAQPLPTAPPAVPSKPGAPAISPDRPGVPEDKKLRNTAFTREDKLFDNISMDRALKRRSFNARNLISLRRKKYGRK